MILYHGSNIDIDIIDLNKSKPYKDFGRGFYLSADKEQATRMAEFKTFQIGGKATINKFVFDESVMSNNSLNVKTFDGYTEEWALFVLSNRNSPNGNSTHEFDIVYGPIANDRVGVQIRRFVENEISLETFIERLKFMKGITYQYFFGTNRAIKYLKRI